MLAVAEGQSPAETDKNDQPHHGRFGSGVENEVDEVKEEVVRPREAIDHEPNRLPKEAGYLADSPNEKQHLGPIGIPRPSHFKLFQVVMQESHPCNDDEGHNVPMIFFFSYLSIVVQQVQLHLQQ